MGAGAGALSTAAALVAALMLAATCTQDSSLHAMLSSFPYTCACTQRRVYACGA